MMVGMYEKDSVLRLVRYVGGRIWTFAGEELPPGGVLMAADGKTYYIWM